MKHGLVKSASLTDVERGEVRALAQACNEREGLDLPLSWEQEAPARVSGPVKWLLYYQHGALSGFAGLEGPAELEVYGMVDPDHRRRGVGRALLEAARAECRARGGGKLIVAVEEVSASGRAFAASVGARFSFAEYSMELDRRSIDQGRPRIEALRLRRATAVETGVIAGISSAAFGDPLEAQRRGVEQGMAQPNQRYFLALLHDDPIGTLRVSDHAPHVYITAFGVLPAHQGRGYGRQILIQIIDMLLAEGRTQIRIEVETENRAALGLYEACGFRQKTAYRYHELPCAAT